MDERTVKYYFKRGTEKGFSKEYVKQIMINKGYDAGLVNYVYNELVQEQIDKETPQDYNHTPRQFEFEKIKPEIKNPSNFSLKNKYILAILTVFIIVSLVFVFYPEERTVTSAVVGVESVESRLNEITEMDEKIGIKKDELRKQLDDLKEKDLTIEEKNLIIRQQIKELEKLHLEIDQERVKIRELLLDLLNSIIKRPNKY